MCEPCVTPEWTKIGGKNAAFKIINYQSTFLQSQLKKTMNRRNITLRMYQIIITTDKIQRTTTYN